MGRYHSYLNSALKILQLYNGEMPFSIFIKHFFSKEKKYGSKDRKQIAAICYSYFRAGLALQKKLSPENLLQALFLANEEPSSIIKELKPEWDGYTGKPAHEKIKLLHESFATSDIFPFTEELNDEMDIDLFCQSFLQKPALFARIRPPHKRAAIEKINASGIEHHFLNNNNSVQFLAGTNIETFLTIDKEVVVQDYNSQQVFNFIAQNKKRFLEKETTVWDCCAASGGKSILMYDLLDGQVKLTVSDIRQSIMANLQLRFKNAGIKNYQHFIADIHNNANKTPATSYDVIICDVPCTGSGTWGRTPEQLYFFNPFTIEEFTAKQKKIAANALAHLNANGFLFYITCSVFKKENEEVAEHLSKQPGMELIEMKNLFGYEMKADSMFVAVLRKNAH